MSEDRGLIKRDPSTIMEAVIAKGDLSQLTPDQRVQYYRETCNSLGLNPLTQPFQYITLNNKLTLYATRAATDQLRKVHGVSTTITSETERQGIYIVKARATDREGRTEESTGAVSIEGLKGDALCNALMKAETKAKRRATLALVGLGWLDESEVETIPGARTVLVEAIDTPANGQAAQPRPEPTKAHPVAGQPGAHIVQMCADCGHGIEATGQYTAEQVADMTLKAWGKRGATGPICHNCHGIRRVDWDAKKAVAAEADAVPAGEAEW